MVWLTILKFKDEKLDHVLIQLSNCRLPPGASCCVSKTSVTSTYLYAPVGHAYAELEAALLGIFFHAWMSSSAPGHSVGTHGGLGWSDVPQVLDSKELLRHTQRGLAVHQLASSLTVGLSLSSWERGAAGYLWLSLPTTSLTHCTSHAGAECPPQHLQRLTSVTCAQRDPAHQCGEQGDRLTLLFSGQWAAEFTPPDIRFLCLFNGHGSWQFRQKHSHQKTLEVILSPSGTEC